MIKSDHCDDKSDYKDKMTMGRPNFRPIMDDDFAAIAALLSRGFPKRNLQFWIRALGRLKLCEHPSGLPKYGYILESDGAPVGVLLFTWGRVNGTLGFRCNLSSWYVEPNFRAYASLFSSHAFRRKDVTYLNVSPRQDTLPIIEAQGFSRYSEGNVVAMPMLNGMYGPRAKVFRVPRQPEVEFDPSEHEILLQHAGHGCISLWCESANHAYPFVFRPRRVKRVIPCAQMIYCREIAEFVHFAGPIGRFLALRGKPFVIVDANGPIPGLIGAFSRGWMSPKYFKGPQRPRLGDLSYTEFAILGV
jgi:hypothetical protein